MEKKNQAPEKDSSKLPAVEEEPYCLANDAQFRKAYAKTVKAAVAAGEMRLLIMQMKYNMNVKKGEDEGSCSTPKPKDKAT